MMASVLSIRSQMAIIIDKKLAILYNYLEKVKVNISNTGGNKYGKN